MEFVSCTLQIVSDFGQRPKLNRGKWKALEGQVRRLLQSEYTTLWIVSGTLFTNHRPSHYRASIGAMSPASGFVTGLRGRWRSSRVDGAVGESSYKPNWRR